jgi:hypothetical protein
MNDNHDPNERQAEELAIDTAIRESKWAIDEGLDELFNKLLDDPQVQTRLGCMGMLNDTRSNLWVLIAEHAAKEMHRAIDFEERFAPGTSESKNIYCPACGCRAQVEDEGPFSNAEGNQYLDDLKRRFDTATSPDGVERIWAEHIAKGKPRMFPPDYQKAERLYAVAKDCVERRKHGYALFDAATSAHSDE